MNSKGLKITKNKLDATQLHFNIGTCSSKMATTKFNKCTCHLWLSQTDLLSQCQPFSSTSNHRTYAEGRIPKTCAKRVFLRIRAFPKLVEAMKKNQAVSETSETVEIFSRILTFTETVTMFLRTPRFTKTVEISEFQNLAMKIVMGLMGFRRNMKQKNFPILKYIKFYSLTSKLLLQNSHM